jgi:hypothetical protein
MQGLLRSNARSESNLSHLQRDFQLQGGGLRQPYLDHGQRSGPPHVGITDLLYTNRVRIVGKNSLLELHDSINSCFD